MTPRRLVECALLFAVIAAAGGVWRYAVRAGHTRFVVDDERRYAPGESVGIVLPAAALHLFPSRP